MSSRDKLRQSALSSRPLETKIVKFGEDEYEIRQPTIGGQGDISRQAGLNVKDQNMDLNEWQFALLQGCVYAPGTNEKVFELADKEAFLNQPPGGLFGELLAACHDLFAKAPENAAKN